MSSWYGFFLFTVLGNVPCDGNRLENTKEAGSFDGPVPEGGWQCETTSDCSLNGICDIATRTCLCDPDWTGSRCGVLNLQDDVEIAFASRLGSSGTGSAIRGEDGRVHMFVEDVPGCPFAALNHYARITRAVADDFEGPFEYQSVAIGMHANYPQILKDPAGGFLLFYLSDTVADLEIDEEQPVHSCSELPRLRGQRCVYVVHSQSIAGPWQRKNARGIVCEANVTDRNGVPQIGSPTPIILPNGTVFLYHTARPTTSSASGNEILALAVARSWEGPYESVEVSAHALRPICDCCVDRPKPSLPHQILGEDIAVWQNSRGEFHLIGHACYGNVSYSEFCGEHAYSTNGVDWTLSPVIPYHTQQLALRDRPRVVTKHGVVQFLFNAAAQKGSDPFGRKVQTAIAKVGSSFRLYA